MGKLILLRHGKSVWNKKNIFTGWVDVSLSKEGIDEAFSAGKALSHLRFEAIFTSTLSRAIMTLQLLMLENQDERTLILNHPERKWCGHGIDEKRVLMAQCSEALNERYYGDFQGKNKDEIKLALGEKKFIEVRRSFQTPPPHGESLKMTVERTLPYFKKEILPQIKMGKTVLVVAHGNSIRGIVKEVMHLTDEEIVTCEIKTGEPLVFQYEGGNFKEGAL